MKQKPLISIVTVCFNAEQRIEETILNVLNQDYPKIEFIVVDGQSKDGTMEIVHKYKDKIAKMISEPDTGVYNAMNKAVAIATGEYMYFMGAGDTFVSNRALSQLMDNAENADVVAGDVNVVDESGKFIYIKTHEWLNHGRVLLRDFVCHQGVLIRSAAIRAVGGFDEKFKVCADYDQILKILLVNKGTISYVPMILANYPADGVSSVTSPERIDKVNAEFDSVRSQYRTALERLKSAPLYKSTKLITFKVFTYVRAVLNLFTSWIVLPWWLFLKYLVIPKGIQKRVMILPEFSSHGGTRTYLLSLIEYYQSRNWEVAVGLDESQQQDQVMLDYLRQNQVVLLDISNDNVVLRLLAKYLWSIDIVRHNLTFISALRKFKPELVVASAATNGLFMNIFLLPVRILYILHMYPSASLGLWNNLLIRSNLSARKQLFTVSDYSLDAVHQIWKLPAHSYLKRIYNFAARPKAAKQEHEGVNVLTIGLLEQYKAPDVWTEVARQFIAKHPEVKINFYWAGDGKLFDYCQSRTEPIRSQVTLLGLLDQQQLSSYYAISDIYLQPSRADSFGLSAAEAMLYGIPVIGSGYSALGETAPHQIAGLVVDAESVGSYVAAVEKLVFDVELRAQLGSQASQLAQKMYTYEAWLKNLDQLHIELSQ